MLEELSEAGPAAQMGQDLLTQMGGDFLSNLDPATRDHVARIADDLIRRRGTPQTPGEVNELVDELRGAIEARPELHNTIRRQMPDGPPQGPGPVSPVPNPFDDPGGARRGDPFPGRPETSPDGQLSQSLRNWLDNVRRNGADNPRTGPGNATNLRPGRPGRANTPSNPGSDNPGSSRGNPPRDANNRPTQPPANRNGGSADRAPQSTRSRPQESLAARFNRMVMDAAAESVERPARGGDGDSGIPASVNNLMSDMLENAHRTATSSNPNLARDLWRGVNRAQRTARRTTSANNWRRFVRPAAAGDVADSARGVNWLLWISIALALPLLYWIAHRRGWTQQVAEYLGVGGEGPLEFDTIQNQHELVVNVDRLLLRRFGLPARWWNSRKVYQQLTECRPSLKPQIAELMRMYEIARYAPPVRRKESLHAPQVVDTLRLLAQNEPSTI